MSARLDLPTVDTRARGLGLHLLRRADLELLAGSGDVASLARALTESARLSAPVGQPATAAGVELAARRTAAAHLKRLARWTGGSAALDFFYADQDRRSLRAMLRGAIEGASAESRLAGLLPSPRLPERALRELAEQGTPAKVVLHLIVLRYPDGPRLLPLATRARPVLFELELELVRGFAERVRLAAKAGDRHLRAAAAERIDVLNLEMALMAAESGPDVDPEAAFVAGGVSLTRSAYVEAFRAGSRGAATATLTRSLAGTPLADLTRDVRDAPALERRALASSLARERLEARLAPLGSAPLLWFLLRLEAQSRDIRRLAWGASLRAPAAQVTEGFVTPWS